MPHTPNTATAAKKVMTEAEAAEFLGLRSRESLRRLRRDGKVSYLRYSDKTVVYELDWLEEYKAASRVTAEIDTTGRVRSGRAA